MIITSVNNELVKETAKLLQKKYREETGLFLLEGEKCVEEAIASGIKIERIFVQKDYNIFAQKEVIETNEAVLSKISSTETPPKIVCVAKQNITKWSENFKKVILLDGIKDAGNLGTIIRTAAAFQIDALILYGDTVDLYNPKCVRASVGNLWKVPVFNINNIEDLKSKFSGFEKIATLPNSKNTISLNEYKPAEKTLVMFGSEAIGLSEELKDFSTKNVTIEMSKNVESLNLSISAGIILHKLFTHGC